MTVSELAALPPGLIHAVFTMTLLIHVEHGVRPHTSVASLLPSLMSGPTRHPGYPISQQKRKRIEEIFGWLKTVAGLRKARHRGAARVGWMFRFTLAA